MFESGVAGYSHFKLKVNFPIDEHGEAHESCEFCPLFQRISKTCFFTGERIIGAEKYVGDFCPLEEIDEKEENT